MTTPIFRKQGDELVEQEHWTVPNPSHYNFGSDQGKIAPFEHTRYKGDVRRYFSMIRDLRRYTLADPNDWEENKDYPEGSFDLLEAQEARIFSDALGLDHKKLPIRGLVALPKETIKAKLDSNPGAFKSQHPITAKAEESQEDIWDKEVPAFSIFLGARYANDKKPLTFMANEIIDYLKSQYHITRK